MPRPDSNSRLKDVNFVYLHLDPNVFRQIYILDLHGDKIVSTYGLRTETGVL
jgi:hypothetical protein